MTIKIRVPIYKNGVFDHFNYHELKVSGRSYAFGNCHFMGDYELKDPELGSGLNNAIGEEIYQNDITTPGNVVEFSFGSFNTNGDRPLMPGSPVLGNIHTNNIIDGTKK